MALKSPLVPSPGGLISHFSPYSDSPASPALPKSPRFAVMVHESSDSLRPMSSRQSPRPTSAPFEPTDPSPITSDKTDIEDSTVDDETSPAHLDPMDADGQKQPDKPVIDTSLPMRPRSSSSETPQSVIHAPEGFRELGSEPDQTDRSSPNARKTPSPAPRYQPTLETGETQQTAEGEKATASPASPPPISTAVDAATYSIEEATPRAHTRQEVEAFSSEKGWRQRTSSSLEDIPEAQDPEHGTEEELYTEDDEDPAQKTRNLLQPSEEEINALKAALTECWTLCNTLAGLSSIHRQRIFHYANSGDAQQEQQAWKSCWKLCQKLYESREEDHDSQVTPILDLCRDFCQSLFEVRQRANDVTDSVLRVSFELNNHLYNTHDRNLPEAFRERTLDFYVTLCHRLMKQRTRLAEETDSLLRTCWSLAEMLFSLRQNRREGKPPDEELLGSAVQACWDLCDLFREGWTQVRPDRGTPRPTQTTFSHGGNSMKQHKLDTVEERRTEPETPTTIFEDMALSPDGEDARPPPNILVLGTDNPQGAAVAAAGGVAGARWSSNASTLSDYSQGSVGTSSTVRTSTTTAVASEDSHLSRLKMLILKAAMNSGFDRASGQTLHTFGQTLTPTSFGTLEWQMRLLQNYKHMIMTDSAFRTPVNLPPRRVSAPEMARAVEWMVRSGQYTFLVDLFRLVFGFPTELAEERSQVLIQT